MASRFWVGGTGTWDAADTTHWSATDNGAGGASVPGSADTATFNANSGGGTVTVSHATNTIQTLTMSAFTGTIDFSANDNNITLTTAFVKVSTGTCTLNMGDGIWTLSATSGTLWDTSGTNFTLNANGSTLDFACGTATGNRTFGIGASRVFNIVHVSQTGGFNYEFIINATTALTIATFQITPPMAIQFTALFTTVITNAMAIVGTAFDNAVLFRSNTTGNTATISTATGTATFAWCVFKTMAFTGGATFTATNSFDCKGNSGISISGPSGGGAVARVVGG